MHFLKILRVTPLCLFLFYSVQTSAQDFSVSGKVTSEEGPLAGVNIMVQGTTYGNFTDKDGNYTLLISNQKATLIFSYIGYKTVTISVGNQSNIDVFMELDATRLDALVVTGYAEQTKRYVSGSISTVDPEEIRDVPVSSIQAKLQGRASGVNVIYSGKPGEVPMVRIRGFNSIRVKDRDTPLLFPDFNDPLYIVDGTPVNSNVASFINPNDIESIQVLKDAAAASIYGARAAKGVIILTTKSGKKNKGIQLTFDAYTGVEIADNLPEFTNPSELVQVIKERQLNSGWDLNHPQYLLKPDSLWGLPDYIFPTGYSVQQLGDLDISNYSVPDSMFTQANQTGTNWMDEIFEPGIIQNYSLGISGNSEIGEYYFSLGYFDQEGVIKHTGFSRFSTRINSRFNISKKLAIGQTLNISYNIYSQNNPESVFRNAAQIPRIVSIYDMAGNFAGTQPGGLGTAGNPVAILERGKHNSYDMLNLFGAVFLEWNIIPELQFKTLFSPNYSLTFENKNFIPLDPENREARQTNILSQQSYNARGWTWYNVIAYEKSFNKNHSIQALVGFEAIDQKYSGFGTSRNTYEFEDVNYQHLNAGEQMTDNWGISHESSLFSLFASVDYRLKQKYILNATIRRDGSSRFSKKNRYGTFPAISIGWIFSEESFMKNLTAINYLKFRGSFGQVGNQEILDYNFYDTYQSDWKNASYSIDGNQHQASVGFHSSTFGDPTAKWETTTTIDIGMDMSMFNNTLSFQLDIYKNLTSDMLISYYVPATRGQASSEVWSNLGDIENTGLDAVINYNHISKRSFKWGAGFVFSHYRNKVIKLNNSEEMIPGAQRISFSPTTVTMEGEAISSFFGYKINGFFETIEQVDTLADHGFTSLEEGLGRWIFEDINQDGKIDNDDKVIIGSPHPDFTFGIPLSFSIKNISLDLFWYGSYGNEIVNDNKRISDFGNPNESQSKRVLKSWGRTGVDDPILPRLVMEFYDKEVATNTYFVEDGSYLRLRHLTLSYLLKPSSWIKNQSMRFYIQINNVFTITSYEGMDPMVRGLNDLRLGIDSGNYPLVRSYIFGINLVL